MSGVGFTLTYEDAGIVGAVHSIEAFGGNPSAMFEDMGAELEASTSKRLRETNLAPDGTPWAPSLRVKLEGGKTLFETGEHLESSLRYELDGRFAVEVGSPWEGAAVHQAGATIEAKSGFLSFHMAGGGYARVKSVDIPARPYLGVSTDDGVAILNIAGEHLRLAVAGNFVGRG